MRAPHPVNFSPHLYDGYTPEERRVFRKENVEIVFYKLDSSFLSNHKKEIEKCNQRK